MDGNCAKTYLKKVPAGGSPVSLDELLRQIQEELKEQDGEFIADIASQVLDRSIWYMGDSLFADLDKQEKVVCSICHQPCSSLTVHLHDGSFIGDECCWDDRLKGSE